MNQDILSWYFEYNNINKDNKIIYLATHPQTKLSEQRIYQGNLDSEFTERGNQQLERMIKVVKTLGLKRIYSSPTDRSSRTAIAVGQAVNIEPIIITQFHATKFGDFEGKKRSELVRKYPEFYKNRHGYAFLFQPYPKGESYFDIEFRVLLPLLDITRGVSPTLIFGHSTVNRILRTILLELPLCMADTFTHDQNHILKIDLATKDETQIELDA